MQLNETSWEAFLHSSQEQRSSDIYPRGRELINLCFGKKDEAGPSDGPIDSARICSRAGIAAKGTCLYVEEHLRFKEVSAWLVVYKVSLDFNLHDTISVM